MARLKVPCLVTSWNFMMVLCCLFCTGTSQGISCSRPTPPANAYIYTVGRQLKEKYGLKDVVMFHCREGYRLSFVECLTHGWSKTDLKCPPTNCSDPGTPANGGRQGDVFTFNSKVNFTCAVGYEVKGSVQRVCQENGTWSGTRATCERVECRDLGAPRNGVRRPDKNKYVYQDRVIFRCNRNHILRGDTYISCLSNRIWTGTVPRCLAPCRDPGIPVGGLRYQHSFLHNKVVRFQCKRGWFMEGSRTIRCTNGRWDHATPTCSDCASALGMESGKIPDGNIQASSTRFRYHAKDGRLNGRYAWCSGMMRDPYLQIDFGKPYRITGLATQGSAYDNRWVEHYTVKSNLAGSTFNMYRQDNRDKMFIGNRDNESITRNKLKNPVIARRIRIYPQKQGRFSALSPACMRVEIYGCDLPSDCVMAGSRLIAKWANYRVAGISRYIYYKAYLTSISSRYWKVELENENHGRPAQKYLPKYTDLPFVLDVPPKHEEVQVGTRVLAPWSFRYYSGTIRTGRDRYNRYRVRADDGDEKDFTIDQIRLLKAPTLCN